MRAVYKSRGITRLGIWRQLSEETTPPKENSSEADLFRMLVGDLSTGRIIRQERQEDIQKVADRHNTDKDELQFATWLTKSRCFTILRLKQVDPINDPGKKTIQIRSVMIPLLDMINHSSDQPNAELEVIETKIEDESFYALQATRPIKANEEITISYGSGQDSSLDLFMNYGFVPYSNPFDIDFLRSEIQQESGSDCFTRPDQWSTTLKEDEEQLASMERAAISKSNSEDIRRRILEFRIQMKRALLEI